MSPYPSNPSPYQGSSRDMALTSKGRDVSSQGSRWRKRDRLRVFLYSNFLLVGMAIFVSLARYNPAFGRVGGPLRPELTVNTLGVSGIFFISGLTLKLAELTKALTSFNQIAFIQFFNLIIVPAFGWVYTRLLQNSGAALPLLDGLLYVSCLPTTINMCILLTQAAGGNQASSIFNAVLSNGIGVFITPALIFFFLGNQPVAVPYFDVIKKLVLKVVLPVALGQLFRASRRVVSKVDSKQAKPFIKIITETILLSIIYTTFCQSFLKGLSLSGRDLSVMGAAVPVFHTCMLSLAFLLARALRFTRRDQVAAMFTASQKTLAFGMPLLSTIFEGSPHLGLYTAPILLIHPTQLLIGTIISPFLRDYIKKGREIAP